MKFMKTTSMQNMMKVSIAGIALIASGGISLAGDCGSPAPGIFICMNGEVCSNVGGCNCSATNWTIENGAICTPPETQKTTPIATIATGEQTVNITNTTATYGFSSSIAGKLYFQGSCGTPSTNTATTGNNSINYANLSNKTYNDCKIILENTENFTTAVIDVPSFTINYTAPSNPGTTSYGGGGWWGYSDPTCTTTHLICTNGTRQKKANISCTAWDYGKTCEIDLTGVIAGIKDLTMTGYLAYIEGIKTNTKITEKQEQEIYDVKIRLYTPRFSNRIIKNIIKSLNTSVFALASKKLGSINDGSFMIENYENISADTKTNVYKSVGAFIKTYNDFVLCLYAIIDLKKTEYLPIWQYFLKKFFTEFAKMK